MFGVAFQYAGSLWFLFIVEVPPCEWGWMSDLSRFFFREVCVSVLAGEARSLLSGVQRSVQ